MDLHMNTYSTISARLIFIHPPLFNLNRYIPPSIIIVEHILPFLDRDTYNSNCIAINSLVLRTMLPLLDYAGYTYFYGLQWDLDQ
jgi:hypothetical protein